MNDNFKKAADKVRKQAEGSQEPAPVYDCEVCKDTGLRLLQPGETFQTAGPNIRGEGSSPTTVKVGTDPDGKPYPSVSVDCEACLPKRQKKQQERYQDQSGFTTVERAYRLNTIKQDRTRPGTKAMTDAGLEMLKGDCSMLTIWGKNGNAKTLLLQALVNEFLERGTPALYITAFDLLGFIRDAFNTDGTERAGAGSELDRLDMLKSVKFLAIDEFQAIKETDWALSILDNLIDARYRGAIAEESMTVLAMNENPDQLTARIYSRIQDKRLRKNSSPIIYNPDPDLRKHMTRKE